MALLPALRTAALAAALLGAALNAPATAQAPAPPPAAAQAPILKVGSTPTGVPFTFLDTKTNSIQGIMVDLVTAVGKEAGFGVQVEPMQFSTLIAGLQASKIDLIAAAMYITPVRQEVVDFSSPIYAYGEGLFVAKADTKDYRALEDLKGEMIGVQVGTAYVEPMKKTGLFSEVKIYDTIPDIMRDVNAGRIKAGFADLPIVAYNLQQGGFPAVRLVKDYKSTLTGSVGIAVRKGEADLLRRVNAALAKLRDDGTMAKVLAKWGIE